MLNKKTAVVLTVLAGFASAEVMAATEWNVSLWGKRRAFTEHVEKLAELVDKKTNGDFKLKISYGGLSKSKENLDGISIGAFEMAQFCSFYHSKKNPTITVSELPFSKELSLARIAAIQAEIYKHPIVAKDLARWNATLLMPSPMPQYNIISKTEPLQNLDGFKGMRIRGPGGIMGVLGKKGAVKTGVPFAEVRQSMDSGVIDAASFAPHAHLATKTYAVGKWYTTNLNLGTADCPVVVNTNALDSLKPAHKKALLGSVKEAIDFYVSNYNSNTVSKYEAEVKAAGLKKITFTKAQTKELNELAASVREDWVKENSAEFNAKELFDYTQKLVNK
ncbi:MAG: TRAP transporter substrate-binding protein DctP [Gammaproteobacteria bacterium]|nr:TRAP transporter substrate-binding protein DctP [Gammaproteobacteria bacterium]